MLQLLYVTHAKRAMVLAHLLPIQWRRKLLESDGVGNHLKLPVAFLIFLGFMKSSPENTNIRDSSFYQHLKSRFLHLQKVYLSKNVAHLNRLDGSWNVHYRLVLVKIGSDDDQFVQRRQQSLQRWLRAIVRHHALTKDPDLQAFLTQDNIAPATRLLWYTIWTMIESL